MIGEVAGRGDRPARRRGEAKPRPQRARRMVAEALEERALLANIIWTNDGRTNDADTFRQAFGADAPAARRIVRQAIADWNRVIADFNFASVGKRGYASHRNTFKLSIFGNFGERGSVTSASAYSYVDRSGRDRAGKFIPAYGAFGKPYAGIINVPGDIGRRGWYFDPTPDDSVEFPNIIDASAATADLGGRYDFYSVVSRLIGKAVGLNGTFDNGGVFSFDRPPEFYVTLQRLNKSPAFDPRTGTRDLLYKYPTADQRIPGSAVTLFTSAGAGGLYPGPLTPKLAARYTEPVQLFPDDLMTADLQPNTRYLISDLDANMLRLGYDYSGPMTVNTPTSDVNLTMLRRLDPRTGTLTITSDPKVASNRIDLSGQDGAIYAGLNGAPWSYPAQTRIREVIVNANGSDTVTIVNPPSNVPIHVVGDGRTTLVLDARGSNPVQVNDQVIVTTTSYNGIPVGEIDYQGVTGLRVLGSDATAIDVFSTPGGTSVAIDGAGNLTMGFAGNVDQILGPVAISGTVGNLTISAAAGTIPRMVRLGRDSVVGLAPAPITLGGADLTRFFLGTPAAASSLVVDDTPQNSRGNLVTQVVMGPGDDPFVVRRTTGDLVVDAGGGQNLASVVFPSVFGTLNLRSDQGTLALFAGAAGAPGVFASMGLQERGGLGFVRADGRAPVLYRVAELSTLVIQLAPPAPGSTFGALLTVEDTARGREGFSTQVQLGGAADVVSVVKSSGPLSILGLGGPGYQVRLGERTRSLGGIRGPLTVSDAGVDVLDQDAPAAEVVGVAADRLTVNGTTAVNLSDVTRLRYNGPDRANTYNIDATPGGELTVNGGTAADTFHVAPAARSLDGLGQVVLDGGGGGDRLTVDDSKAGASPSYGVTSAPLFGLPITYITRGPAAVFGSGFASATLTGSGLPATYAITAAKDGIVTTIRAGAGDDRFLMQAAGAGAALTLDGGGGTNTLDYSAVKPRAQAQAQVAAPAAAGAVPVPSGLVAWYRAEGGAGDATGQHNGIPTKVTYGPGEVGQAFQLDGTGSVIVPDAPDLEPQTLTVETWVKPTPPSPNGPDRSLFVFSKGYYDDYLAYTTGNNLFFQLTVQIGPSVTAASVQASVDPAVWIGRWHHLAGTYDGSTLRLYVDGEQVASARIAAPLYFPPEAPDKDLHIGNIPGAGADSYGFPGSIDEFSFYSRALSDAEIRSIYAAGPLGKAAAPPPPPPGPAPGVEVNLQTGRATGFAGGISHIQQVIGTTTDDILVGDGGDTLDGGGGRDLLIAGRSASTLNSRGDSILIGGTTVYDSDPAALDAVLAEWVHADATYADRANSLVNGLLAPGKVADNGQRDRLNGGPGKNLFFRSAADTTDARDDERQVVL